MDAQRKQRWWKAGGIALLAIVSAGVFAAYTRPDMVLTFATAVMALCGF
jgi:hypothetical protein